MWIADGWNDYEVIDCSGRRETGAVGRLSSGSPGPAGYLEHPKTHRGWKR